MEVISHLNNFNSISNRIIFQLTGWSRVKVSNYKISQLLVIVEGLYSKRLLTNLTYKVPIFSNIEMAVEV